MEKYYCILNLQNHLRTCVIYCNHSIRSNNCTINHVSYISKSSSTHPLHNSHGLGGRATPSSGFNQVDRYENIFPSKANIRQFWKPQVDWSHNHCWASLRWRRVNLSCAYGMVGALSKDQNKHLKNSFKIFKKTQDTSINFQWNMCNCDT